MAAVRGMYVRAALSAAVDTMAVPADRPFLGDLYWDAGLAVYAAGRLDIAAAGPPENTNDHRGKGNSRSGNGRIPAQRN